MGTYLGKSKRKFTFTVSLAEMTDENSEFWGGQLLVAAETLRRMVDAETYHQIIDGLGNTWTSYHCLKIINAKLEELKQETSQDCNCFLPEQSCPVCRATARRVYGKEGTSG